MRRKYGLALVSRQPVACRLACVFFQSVIYVLHAFCHSSHYLLFSTLVCDFSILRLPDSSPLSGQHSVVFANGLFNPLQWYTLQSFSFRSGGIMDAQIYLLPWYTRCALSVIRLVPAHTRRALSFSAHFIVLLTWVLVVHMFCSGWPFFFLIGVDDDRSKTLVSWVARTTYHPPAGRWSIFSPPGVFIIIHTSSESTYA